MTEKNNDIEKILEERARLDAILHDQFSKRVAIMFTDIKGSTSFYEKHGDLDGRMMVHRHNEVVMPAIKENKGEVLKTIGDATMSAYDDPAEAVRAAVAVQKRLQTYNDKKSQKEQIHVRVGINYGVGIVEESDVYGDVVNLASRLESLADADEVMVSEDLYREVRSNDEFIFRYFDSVSVKGKSEPIKAYRLIWRNEDLHLGRTRKAVRAVTPKEGLFVIEASLAGSKLKISGFERADGEERPVKNYQEVPYHVGTIGNHTREITGLLNRANRRGKIGNDIFIRLKEVGGLLFDELIPQEIKGKLLQTEQKHLSISIDDTLVQIPWELLYDGRDFLCQRFSIGRSVSTKQPVSAVSRAVGRPLKMQILADPRGDLKAAYEEGLAIKSDMEKLDDWVDVSLRTTDIKTDYVRSKIRNFDIVHYAGHAEHVMEHPEESGWLLKDGTLKAGQIMTMTGQMPMPSLIFSNACQSGQTDEWRLSEDYEHRIFGLANAFLLTGVQHYIGTFWEIPDEAGCHFAVNFYQNLIDGMTIGEAVRQARQALIDKYGEDTIVWACYMLYGDPTTRYIDPSQESLRSEPAGEEKAGSFVSVEAGTREQVFSATPGKRSPVGLLAVGAALVLIAGLAGLFLWGSRPADPKVQAVVAPPSAPASDEKSRKRIDELVASLAASYRQGNFDRTKVGDARKTGPLTMVIMDVKPSGTGATADRDNLVNMLTAVLQEGEGVQMVERELLEKLLEELKLSNSSLADPTTALKIGKVLSARIIITGSIMADSKGQAVMLRLIDTETTAVRKVVSAETTGKTLDRETVKQLGGKILEWAKAENPSSGNIEGVKNGATTKSKS
ncbi:MAG: CHAT domain-containing protein [Nitrospirae bacterium]|nr:MAG: CHAT domain-containing protein [Nitrospirota bacterium]